MPLRDGAVVKTFRAWAWESTITKSPESSNRTALPPIERCAKALQRNFRGPPLSDN